ncbi:hypothetical protein HMPREF3213_01535 [Heyndrickxia coagulans]|uniref:Uncharacterized protein n=1 Tax=Heyndrickxia coagulans TaxID=1398 RepID=A0A0C5CB17_HEYCO|nr:hypothetical protein SB48_HM08orf04937 [Heyndrickxia coagulans]KWZ83050.1 hypothetical protein HMPREF3213_01535 [Heyndrickxia coagulans]
MNKKASPFLVLFYRNLVMMGIVVQVKAILLTFIDQYCMIST